MSDRHPLDGNAIAADRYYDREDDRHCPECDELLFREPHEVRCPECGWSAGEREE